MTSRRNKKQSDKKEKILLITAIISLVKTILEIVKLLIS